MELLTPENDPGQTAQKPGYRTTEFYLALAAMLVGALMAAGVFPADSPWLKGLGVAASVLGALGYTVQRGMLKASGNKAAAIVAVASVAPPSNPH